MRILIVSESCTLGRPGSFVDLPDGRAVALIRAGVAKAAPKPKPAKSTATKPKKGKS